jgi:P-type Cu2+ transporter
MTLAAGEIAAAMDGTVASQQVLCAHCGLPVPLGLREAGAKQQFCCQGCRTVFAVIHSCRMEQYYAFAQQDRTADGAAVPARVTGKAYREFDDPAFLALHAPLRAVEGGQNAATRTIDFYLEGVHCAACVWLVEKLPRVMPGVLEARLSLGQQLVRITWAEAHTTASAIARTLDSLGYPPHPARSSTARQVRTRDDRRQLIRIGVAGACAGNTMLLATALYAGLFATMDPAYVLLFRWLSMLIGLVALAWPGSVFFRGAWAAIRTRTAHLDLPIALALAAGGVVGAINTVRNTGEIYFDSLSVLVFLLLVGRFLQHRQQGLAEDAVELLFSLTPMAARRVETDGAREAVAEVPITSLKIGDVVEVMPGESMPVDGQLLAWGDRTTTVDESLLTGESRPKRVIADSPVHAGTTNISSPVRVRVLATGQATRVGKLMRLVTECARRKAPMVLFADRIAGWFLIAVLAIAAAVLTGWWLFGPAAGHAVDHAVAILIVACPCALGLATPLAVSVAIGRSARRGILLKGGDTLERLARPGLLLLDKTGTLTTGRIALHTWDGDEPTQSAVAAIEAQATHPVARAFCDAFTPQPGMSATAVAQDMRGGIRGIVAGSTYLIGSPQFVESQCGAIPERFHQAVQASLARGLTPVLVARDGTLVAAAGLGDDLRPDAAKSLHQLRRNGWQLAILSGDHPDIVARIARELGIAPDAAIGGLLPEQKLDIVRQKLATRAARHGPVVMVGDGVNDAAALAAASVGIAVHGGAEASLAAASIYLNQPGLAPILDVMHAARTTISVIHRSLAASLTYNAFAISLAALGWINPLVAAILMPISSLTVLSLALGARTFRRPPAGPARGGVA